MKEKRKVYFRWFILSLLFAATTILYIDRGALGILAPVLQKEIGWNEEQYGLINSAFMFAYAFCFLMMGKLIDRIGTRHGYALSIGLWSLATVAHTFARSWIGFAIARFTLAIGQSGNFPSAIKVVSEWFPQKERALAVSIFNGGSNVGTIIAPLVIPPLVLGLGVWKVGFLWTFPVVVIWIFLWLKFYRRPQSNIEATANPDAVTDEKPVTWKNLLMQRGSWAIAVAKFVADPIWWFYLFWGAKFLNEKFGLNLKEIGLPFFTIYLASWGLGIFLGWFSSKLMQRGFSVNTGRKFSLLACALFALPVILVPHAGNVWIAVGLISLAAGGHCGWSANVFSLMSDIFPQRAVGTISGFGGFAGGIGGVIIAFAVGKILHNVGVDGYAIPFAVAGCGYLIALGIIHLLVPRIQRVKI